MTNTNQNFQCRNGSVQRRSLNPESLLTVLSPIFTLAKTFRDEQLNWSNTTPFTIKHFGKYQDNVIWSLANSNSHHIFKTSFQKENQRKKIVSCKLQLEEMVLSPGSFSYVDCFPQGVLLSDCPSRKKDSLFPRCFYYYYFIIQN